MVNKNLGGRGQIWGRGEGGHEHDSSPKPWRTYELSHMYINKVHVLPEIRLSSLHDEFSDRKS